MLVGAVGDRPCCSACADHSPAAIGSIFGKPTIDEVRHQMRTVEFRIEGAEKLRDRLPFSAENAQLVKDWNTWLARWDAARGRVLDRLLGRKLATPLVPDSAIAASSEMALVESARGTLHEPISLPSLILRLEAASGEKLAEDGAPVPEGFDPDHAAYAAVDEKIKQGEAAAQAFASSGPGQVLIGGLVLGAVAGVVALGFYVRSVLP